MRNKTLSKNECQKFSCLDFHVEELARQITLLDHELFSQIGISEFLGKNMDKEEFAPKLAKMKNHFNAVSNCNKINRFLDDLLDFYRDCHNTKF